MIEDKNVLAIIPARGGSKRLPKKNILPLNDKPLIVWTIEAALESEFIDEVVVTSDDDAILEIASAVGATPVKRPLSLGQDHSKTFEVVEHVLQSVLQMDYTVLLQPTSPLRTSRHIDEAVRLLIRKKAKAVISVTEMDHSPLWANVLPVDDSMVGFISKELANTRSQDLPKHYRVNGAIYICNTECLLREKTFFVKDNVYAFRMDRRSSIDIDTRIDFKWAQFLMNNK